VECQQVVHGGVEFGNGRTVSESGVRSVPVVVVKEAGEISGAHRGVLVGASVSPFAQAGLDKAFGFAIGARSVRRSQEMAQAEALAGLGKELGDVAGAIVAHDGVSLDAEGAEVAQGSLEEGDGALLAFIGHDASKSDAGGIINSDVDIFPAGAFDQIATVACNAVTGSLDAGEFFDVQVNELTWKRTFIAPDRGRWIQ
jgi:hypothetical protein